MKPPADRGGRVEPIEASIEPLVVLLEVAATKTPSLLPWLLTTVAHSPASYMLEELAEAWEVEPKEIGRVAERTARSLDELAASKTASPGPLGGPDLAALFHFGAVRHARTSDPRRQRRLERIGRQIVKGLETSTERRRIRHFLSAAGGDEPAVDRRWLEEFIGK